MSWSSSIGISFFSGYLSAAWIWISASSSSGNILAMMSLMVFISLGLFPSPSGFHWVSCCCSAVHLILLLSTLRLLWHLFSSPVSFELFLAIIFHCTYSVLSVCHPAIEGTYWVFHFIHGAFHQWHFCLKFSYFSSHFLLYFISCLFNCFFYFIKHLNISSLNLLSKRLCMLVFHVVPSGSLSFSTHHCGDLPCLPITSGYSGWIL